MADYIDVLQRLSEKFARLEGVGKKSAMRMAFSVLELDEETVRDFADTLLEAKTSIRECKICGNLTDKDICSVCEDDERDGSVICVVEDVKALLSIEKVREYKGLYHVLGGVISPINGITPDKIRIKELITRVGEGDVGEVIIATNPTPGGDTTAAYLAKMLDPYGVEVSRLAYGIPVGGDIEYADEVTLFRAMEGRRYF